MSERQHIGAILKNCPTVTGSVKCQQCRLRPKVLIQGEQRLWCSRCIEQWTRYEHICREPSDRLERWLCDEVGARYWQANLSDVDPAVRDVLSGARSDQDIFIYGSVGTGKTYTISALLRTYSYLGFTCRKICFDEFCVQLRSTMSAASRQTERDFTEPLKQVDKLFIDDLGLRSKRETDFAYITLYQILDKRQQRLLPTIIVSNKTVAQLARHFDARIASRLSTAVVIEFTGRDRRLS